MAGRSCLEHPLSRAGAADLACGGTCLRVVPMPVQGGDLWRLLSRDKERSVFNWYKRCVQYIAGCPVLGRVDFFLRGAQFIPVIALLNVHQPRCSSLRARWLCAIAQVNALLRPF